MEYGSAGCVDGDVVYPLGAQAASTPHSCIFIGAADAPLWFYPDSISFISADDEQ